MKELLLDDPWPIYLVLALAEVLIAALWHRGRTRRLAAALLIPPLLATAVAIAGMVIVTDRQRIGKALQEIAADVERGDVPACGKYLAADFSGFGGTREGAIAAGEKAKGNYGIHGVTLSGVKIEMLGSQATVTARSSVAYNVAGFGEGRVALDWTVYWAIRDGQWRIIRIEDPKFAQGP